MVVGDINGSHIPMIAFSFDEYAYVNQKQYHSINKQSAMQAICDSNIIFQDDAARWPGSHHDCFILQSSTVSLSMTDLKTTSLRTVGFWVTV